MNTPSAALAALEHACTEAGLDAAGARVIYQRANIVCKLRGPVVARLRHAPDPQKVRPRLVASVQVTTWLGGEGFPAVQPLDVSQPVTSGEYLVTFWHFIPASGEPWRDMDGLAQLLRELHALPAPPFPLPANDPLGSVREDAARCRWLAGNQRSWLLQRAGELQEEYAGAGSALGCGLIHGDAHADNLIHTRHATVLADWDAASRGPREQDLIPTCIGYRYGRPGAEWQRLCQAYQVDPERLPLLPLLLQMRELRALTPYLRAAAGQAHGEVSRRIDDLVSGRQQRPWRAMDMSRGGR
jgi:aminoglycoside phosphotransferase (APT) family kinase protein